MCGMPLPYMLVAMTVHAGYGIPLRQLVAMALCKQHENCFQAPTQDITTMQRALLNLNSIQC